MGAGGSQNLYRKKQELILKRGKRVEAEELIEGLSDGNAAAGLEPKLAERLGGPGGVLQDYKLSIGKTRSSRRGPGNLLWRFYPANMRSPFRRGLIITSNPSSAGRAILKRGKTRKETP